MKWIPTYFIGMWYKLFRLFLGKLHEIHIRNFIWNKYKTYPLGHYNLKSHLLFTTTWQPVRKRTYGLMVIKHFQNSLTQPLKNYTWYDHARACILLTFLHNFFSAWKVDSYYRGAVEKPYNILYYKYFFGGNIHVLNKLYLNDLRILKT